MGWAMAVPYATYSTRPGSIDGLFDSRRSLLIGTGTYDRRSLHFAIAAGERNGRRHDEKIELNAQFERTDYAVMQPQGDRQGSRHAGVAALSLIVSEGFLFPSRVCQSPHLTTRQYARLVNRWVAMVGRGDSLDPPRPAQALES